jgi:hypothetical protein
MKMEKIKKMSIMYKGKMKALTFMADKEKIKWAKSFKIEIDGNCETFGCIVTINGKDPDNGYQEYSRSFLADEVTIRRWDLSESDGFRWGGPPSQ